MLRSKVFGVSTLVFGLIVVVTQFGRPGHVPWDLMGAALGPESPVVTSERVKRCDEALDSISRLNGGPELIGPERSNPALICDANPQHPACIAVYGDSAVCDF